MHLLKHDNVMQPNYIKAFTHSNSKCNLWHSHGPICVFRKPGTTAVVGIWVSTYMRVRANNYFVNCYWNQFSLPKELKWYVPIVNRHNFTNTLPHPRKFWCTVLKELYSLLLPQISSEACMYSVICSIRYIMHVATLLSFVLN